MATFTGVIQVDESYFGQTRPRGSLHKLKLGCVKNKQSVFGIYERGERVYTEIILDNRKANPTARYTWPNKCRKCCHQRWMARL